VPKVIYDEWRCILLAVIKEQAFIKLNAE
jgi:hypothetical protein